MQPIVVPILIDQENLVIKRNTYENIKKHSKLSYEKWQECNFDIVEGNEKIKKAKEYMEAALKSFGEIADEADELLGDGTFDTEYDPDTEIESYFNDVVETIKVEIRESEKQREVYLLEHEEEFLPYSSDMIGFSRGFVSLLETIKDKYQKIDEVMHSGKEAVIIMRGEEGQHGEEPPEEKRGLHQLIPADTCDVVKDYEKFFNITKSLVSLAGEVNEDIKQIYGALEDLKRLSDKEKNFEEVEEQLDRIGGVKDELSSLFNESNENLEKWEGFTKEIEDLKRAYLAG